VSRTPPAGILAGLAIVALLVVGLSLGPSAIAAPADSTSPAVEVHGDDARDRYAGTGGLLLPGGVDRQTRTAVAQCRGCEWRLEPPCTVSPHGTAFGTAEPCLSVVRGCPAGDRLFRSWFRDVAAPWRETGLVCIGRSGPVTVADVDRRLREGFVAGLASLAPAFQPSRHPVTQLPVVFASGQSGGRRSKDFTVVGQPVTLDARPTWVWQFGDGSVVRTDDAGGRFPESGVTHAYRNAGRFTVVVTTHWSATFAVNGLGPFEVSEPITQEESLAIDVGEGRAQLRP